MSHAQRLLPSAICDNLAFSLVYEIRATTLASNNTSTTNKKGFHTGLRGPVVGQLCCLRAGA